MYVEEKIKKEIKEAARAPKEIRIVIWKHELY